MKLTNLLTKSLLATAGATLLQLPAQAMLPYANGDLIMGFRTTGVSNPDGLVNPSGTDYEINLGNATNFINGSASVFADIGADLTAIFGPNWNTRADIFWSISGVVTPAIAGGLGNNTIFVTRPETTIGVQSIPWNRISTFGSGAPAQKIAAMAGPGFGYAAGTSATLNQLESVNSIGGLIQNAGGGNSYASYMPGGANTVGATSFGTFDGIEGNFGAGTAGTVLDLYELIPGSGPSSYLGSFQISDTGTASFTAVVPEPSSLAIVGAGAGLLGLLRRRQLCA